MAQRCVADGTAQCHPIAIPLLYRRTGHEWVHRVQKRRVNKTWALMMRCNNNALQYFSILLNTTCITISGIELSIDCLSVSATPILAILPMTFIILFECTLTLCLAKQFTYLTISLGKSFWCKLCSKLRAGTDSAPCALWQSSCALFSAHCRAVPSPQTHQSFHRMLSFLS